MRTKAVCDWTELSISLGLLVVERKRLGAITVARLRESINDVEEFSGSTRCYKKRVGIISQWACVGWSIPSYLHSIMH